MGLKRSDGLAARSEIAALQTAWNTLRTYQQAEDKHKADTKVLGLVAPMKRNEYSSLKHTFEQVHNISEDSRLPGQSILDRMEAELEDGELAAPKLKELPSQREVLKASENRNDNTGFAMSLSMQGGMKFTQPVKVKLNDPSSPCELRDRIRILWAAYEFLKIKNPLNTAIKSSSKDVWDEHVEYILGDKVKGKEVVSHETSARKSPSWKLILHYEEHIRIKMAKLMNFEKIPGTQDRYDLATALKHARECPVLRYDEFTEIYQLQPMESGKRKRTPSQDSNRKTKAKKEKKADSKKRKRSSSSDDRKKKGKGGSKGKKGDGTIWKTKKDGKPICFRFNSAKGCPKDKCSLEHACQICLKEGHGAHKCTKG
jgi:hypothetical protein